MGVQGVRRVGGMMVFCCILFRYFEATLFMCYDLFGVGFVPMHLSSLSNEAFLLLYRAFAPNGIRV